MSEQAQKEVADEVIDPAARIVALTKRVPELADFGEGLAEAYRQAHGVTFDLSKVRDNDSARKLRKTLVSTRTAVDGRRKELKRTVRESVAQKLALIDEVADAAIGFVESLETPLDQAIAADEQRRADEKKARDDAEKVRIAALRQRVDDINSVAARAVGLVSTEIEQKIALVSRIEVDATFEEFEAAAQAAKANTIARLNELLVDARQREVERAESERNKAELARLQREAEERKAADAAREREAAAQRAREESERAQREEAARREREEAEQKRQAQMAAAQAAVGEIARIARGALTATAASLQAMVTKVLDVRPTIDCGDYAGLVEAEREATVEHLREIVAQKAEQERQAAEQAEALRAAREREQKQQALADEIEVIRRQLFICQEQEHTIEQVEVRIAEMRALAIDPEHFGVLFHSAVAVRDATVTGLEQLLHQMRTPPAPLMIVQAEPLISEPIFVGVDIGAGEDMTSAPLGGAIVFIDAVPIERAAEKSAVPNESFRLPDNIGEAIMLASEVANVAKLATRTSRDGPYTVPAADFQQMCEALTRVHLPGGQRYAADGTLMNGDGTRSIFDDVDE